MTQERTGRKLKRSLTAAEFDAVAPFLNISEDRKKAARMALVDQMTLQSVGNVFGCTKQAVADCTTRVWREFEAYQQSLNAQRAGELPEGWERVTLVAPKELVASFYAQIAEATRASKRKA